MSFLIWLIYVCFASSETEFNVYSVNVRKATDFEFVAVVSALSAAPHNTMWASGTSNNPCEAPWPCIQFYPPKRSVQISGYLKNGYASITFIPENRDLAKIAIVMVEGKVWVPVTDLPNVQCKKSIDISRDQSDKLILVFDEDIKDTILNGEILPFSDGGNRGFLNLLRPYEPDRNYQRKLMRVTGKMDETIQTFTLAIGFGIDATYNFIPTEEATMPSNCVKLLEWPNRSDG